MSSGQSVRVPHSISTSGRLYLFQLTAIYMYTRKFSATETGNVDGTINLEIGKIVAANPSHH